MGLGLLALIAATVWWYLYYDQIPMMTLQDSRECFYFVTDACSVKNTAADVSGQVGSIVGTTSDIPTYHPAAFWAAMVTMLAGLLIWGASD